MKYTCTLCGKLGHNRASCIFDGNKKLAAMLLKPKKATSRKHKNVCGRCNQFGHKASMCPNLPADACSACGSAKHTLRHHVGAYKTTVIAGKQIQVKPLRKGDIAHVAYEPESRTMEVGVRGKFTVVRFRHAPVGPKAFAEVEKARNPIPTIERIRERVPGRLVKK